MKFKQFISSKGPILALVVGLLYGIIVFFIYYSGYSAVPNNVDELPVTMVNQDQKSNQLSKQIKKALPYKHIKSTTSLSSAKKALDARDTFLVINIPKNFATDISANKQPNLNFYINESNQTSVVSAMKSTATTIGNTVQQQIGVQKGTLLITKPQLESLQQQLKQDQTTAKAKIGQQQQVISAAPAEQQAALTQKLEEQTKQAQVKAQQTAIDKKDKIINEAQSQARPLINNININIERQNKVDTGLNNSLAPFFASLSIYLGSLIGALILYNTYAKFAPQIGRFKAFANLELTMLFESIIIAGVVSWAISAMIGTGNFGELWLSHLLTIFAAYNFNSIMLLILGQVGTALNILLTMLQIVAGAGMIPVVTMNAFFKAIHSFTPMYYGITNDFNAMYGGTAPTSLWHNFIALIVGIIVINLIIVTFKKQQTMLRFDKLG